VAVIPLPGNLACNDISPLLQVPVRAGSGIAQAEQIGFGSRQMRSARSSSAHAAKVSNWHDGGIGGFPTRQEKRVLGGVGRLPCVSELPLRAQWFRHAIRRPLSLKTGAMISFDLCRLDFGHQVLEVTRSRRSITRNSSSVSRFDAIMSGPSALPFELAVQA